MSDYVNVTELFGCDVFNDSVMEERLPKKVYKELKKTIEEGKELSPAVADVVAHEMKQRSTMLLSQHRKKMARFL